MYFLPNVVIGNTYKNNGFVRRAFGKNAKAYGVAMQKLKNVGKRTRNFDKKAFWGFWVMTKHATTVDGGLFRLQ